MLTIFRLYIAVHFSTPKFLLCPKATMGTFTIDCERGLTISHRSSNPNLKLNPVAQPELLLQLTSKIPEVS